MLGMPDINKGIVLSQLKTFVIFGKKRNVDLTTLIKSTFLSTLMCTCIGQSIYPMTLGMC